MADTFRIKRRASGAAGAPSALLNSEPAYNFVDDILYIGKGDDGSGNATTIIAIAGAGAFLALTGDQSLAGIKTVTGSLRVPTPINAADAAPKAWVEGLVSAASIPDGDKGDITVSAGGTVWTIDAGLFQPLDAELTALAGLTSAANKVPRFTGSGTADLLDFSTDGTLAANSDTAIASQKAIKTYVDGLIAANDAMVFKGVIDASTNPNYPAADAGHTYRISVAGKIGGASGANVESGDLLLCLADSTAAGDQATVGASWAIVQTNIDGALTTANIGSTVQAYDAGLQSIAGLSTAANQGLYLTGTDTYATFTLTAAGRTFLGAADAAAQIAAMGLGTMATQNANAVAITGGTIDGVVLDGGVY